MTVNTVPLVSNSGSSESPSSSPVTVPSVVPHVEVSAPTSIKLKTSILAISNITTPTFVVETVTSGDTVKIYTDSSCAIAHLRGTAVATNSSVEVSVTDPLPDGEYKFYVQVVSSGGISSPCSEVSAVYTIDTSAPIITNITSNVVNGTYSTAATFDLKIQFSENVTLNTNAGNNPFFELNMNTSPVVTTASYTSGSGSANLNFTYLVKAGANSALLDYTSTAALNLSPGSTLQDSAGNNALLVLPAVGLTGSLSANKRITIAPLSVTIVSPVNSGVISNSNKTSFLVNGSCSEAGQSVSLKLFDGTTNITAAPLCTSGSWSANLNVSTLNDTNIILTAEHKNVYDVTVTAQTLNLTKDTNSPTVTITSPLENATVVNSLSISGSCSEIGKPVSLTISGGFSTSANCLAGSYSSTLDIASASNGAIQITANQTDDAGNSGSSTAVHITKIPPVPLGKVRVNIGFGTSNERAYAMELQSDGKILLAGKTDSGGSDNFAVLRYTTSGSLDVNFGKLGLVTSDFGNSTDSAAALKIQSDGKIILAGTSSVGGNDNFALIRYNIDGTIDASFGTNGKVVTDIGTSVADTVNAMEIQSDGKILVVGATASGNSNFAIVRYNENGSLDTSFDSDGIVTTDIGTNSIDSATAVQVQADGKILVAGRTNSASGDFALVRYTSAGAFDTSFDTDGKVTTDIGTNSAEGVFAMQLQTDGKILVAGNSNMNGSYDFAIVRYASNGALDTSFDTDGKVTTIGAGTHDGINGIKVQEDGSILAVGWNQGAGDNFMVVRYTSSGALDTSFDTDGKLTTNLGTFETATAVRIQSDGKILVGGYYYSGSHYNFAMTRYSSVGVLDTSFDGDGKVTTDIGAGTWDYANAVQVQNDGKILLAGYVDDSNADFALTRLTSAGSLDMNFGSNGIVRTDLGGLYEYAYAMAIQSDGKILVAGFSDLNGSDDFALVRYTSSGSLDSSFGTNGKVVTDIGANSYGYIYALQLQSDGKILAAGRTSSGGGDIALVRYTSAGQLDTSFDGDGIVTTDFGTNSGDSAQALQLQSDGKIVVAGYANISGNTNFTVLRYTSTGALDTSFDTDGKANTDIGSSSSDLAYAMQIQSDGKIVVAGYSNATANNNFVVVRYTTSGALDTSFDVDGKVSTDIGTNSSDIAKAMQIQNDGKIVVAGYSNASGTQDFAVVRYTSTGELDSSFDTDGKVLIDVASGLWEEGKAIQIQSDGKILVAGSTIEYSDNQSDDFAAIRLTATGVLD